MNNIFIINPGTIIMNNVTCAIKEAGSTMCFTGKVLETKQHLIQMFTIISEFLNHLDLQSLIINSNVSHV